VGELLVVGATEPELEGARGLATLVCGVGPVEAAAATARVLATRRPAALLHVGIAGARRASGVRPPALVLGAEALYCDAAGPLVTARVLPGRALLDAARRALPEARVLPVGTSARVGGTTGADVEAMEGFGVLRAAELAGVPAIELRAVSNEIEELDRGQWRFAEALEALAAAIPRLAAACARAL